MKKLNDSFGVRLVKFVLALVACGIICSFSRYGIYAVVAVQVFAFWRLVNPAPKKKVKFTKDYIIE